MVGVGRPIIVLVLFLVATAGRVKKAQLALTAILAIFGITAVMLQAGFVMVQLPELATLIAKD